jgi:PAS domain S-box-containing protein
MHHPGAHDGSLVIVSILVAMLASFAALDLAARIRASSGRLRYAWLGAAAFAMGGGIWSMHFIAMLAFRLPGVEVSYDLGLTLISLVLPIAVTGFGLLVASTQLLGSSSLTVSGLVMGLGIAGMHYTGMAAMRMSAVLHHEPQWVALSILVAIAASIIALWLAFTHTTLPQRLIAALVMGMAVAGMHYTAMYGAVFTYPTSVDPNLDIGVGYKPLALWITGTTVLILMLALAAAMFDRQLADLARREAAALRQSEERFRLLVNGVTDHAIYMLDLEGRVANWNAGAARIHGFDADEIIGLHFSQLYTDDDKRGDLPNHALKTALSTGKFDQEGWRLRKDGSRFWASVTIDPVRNEKGEVVGFAKVTRDITERMRAQKALDEAQAALVQSQKMEAIGHLTGGVAHDFNNLLMVVLSSLDLLRMQLSNADPAVARLIDNAKEGAQRGVALTQRMLAFARRQDLKPVAVDLPDLVRGMSDLLGRSVDPSVQIEMHFPLSLPKASVDPNQLELALLNLAVNARDAMTDGGTITIAAREELGGADTGLAIGRYVSLSVRDTGQGMDEETLRRAQEPFFTTKDVGKGTGLGLSMVHGLAEQSHGRLVLKSRVGEGTTAEIWLPVAEEPTEVAKRRPVAQATSAHPVARSLSVLAVDDDPLILENTAAMLEDLGHRVARATSGERALQKMHTISSLDVVLTDEGMPGMTGLQLLERIRAQRPNMPILLVTGYSDLPSGSHPHVRRLNKPFDQSALARALEAVMSGATTDVVVPLRRTTT